MIGPSDFGCNHAKQVESDSIGRSGIKDVAANYFRRRQVSAVETVLRECVALFDAGKMHKIPLAFGVGWSKPSTISWRDSDVKLRCRNLEPRVSEEGQSRQRRSGRLVGLFPQLLPRADIVNVRNGLEEAARDSRMSCQPPLAMVLGAHPTAIAGCVRQAANFHDTAHAPRRLVGASFPRLSADDGLAFARDLQRGRRVHAACDAAPHLAIAPLGPPLRGKQSKTPGGDAGGWEVEPRIN
jgi:hypothetical protein